MKCFQYFTNYSSNNRLLYSVSHLKWDYDLHSSYLASSNDIYWKTTKGGYTHLVSKYQGVSFKCVDWLSRIFMDNHTSVFIKFEYLKPNSIHDKCIDDACCILACLVVLILRRWPIKDVTKEFIKTLVTIPILSLFQTKLVINIFVVM